MQTFALVSQKGGSGKTTTSVNLAVVAHRDERSVLVVDLDMQASAHDWHEAREDKTLLVLPTHHAALGKVLREAESQGVDFVFIDTAAKTETDTRVAVEGADVPLIPCRPSAMDLRAIMNTVRLCRSYGKTPWVVLTQVEPQGTAAAETRATLEELGVSVLKSTIGRRAAFMHSITDGRGVVEYEPNGKAAAEMRAVYQEIRLLAKKIASNHSMAEAVL